MIKNLTPHAIVIVGGPTFVPCGIVARCAQISAPAGEFDGVPLTSVAFGDVENLPAPEAGVLLIVSALVRTAFPNRTDLVSPGDLVRDAKGVVIGCKSLVVN
jgi:hypothetical protein